MTDEQRSPPTFAEVLRRLTGVQKGTLFAVLLTGSGLTVNGVYQFLKDAPAIVNANTREIRFHHDSIAQNSEFAVTMAEHLATEDSADASRDRKLDYLVCLRTERARELRGDPALRDCDAELLR